MDSDKLNDYVEILEIFINHYKNGRITPLTPKEIKKKFDVGKSSDPQYEQRKRVLDRCMEFYSFIKLITIQTDSTLNEQNRLNRIKKNRWKPLNERKKLDPYIQFIKDERKNNTIKDNCLKYNLVGRYRKLNKVFIDENNDEYTERELELFQTQLPKDFKKYPKDKKGFYTIEFKSGTIYKIKEVEKQPLTFEMFGEKFQNISTDMEKDFIDTNKNKRNLSDDNVKIENTIIDVCDFNDICVRAEDCLYSLTKTNQCNDNYPIEYNLPSDAKIDMFIDFLDRMVDKDINEDGQYDTDLTDPLISTVIKSDSFGDNKRFVSQTIGKLLIFNHNNININNNTEGYYPLDVLIQIIESGNSVDVEFENFGNILKLQNTKIKKIVVSENSFDLHFENFVSQNHTNILQIKKIDNHSEDGLRNDIDKVIELIDGLNEKDKKYFKNKFNTLTAPYDIFVF